MLVFSVVLTISTLGLMTMFVLGTPPTIPR